MGDKDKLRIDVVYVLPLLNPGGVRTMPRYETEQEKLRRLFPNAIPMKDVHNNNVLIGKGSFETEAKNRLSMVFGIKPETMSAIANEFNKRGIDPRLLEPDHIAMFFSDGP